MTHIRIYKELRKVIAGCLAVMLLPLFTACEHKDLCYDHPHSASVEVVFDWTEAPDAHPATMSLYLYPEDGSEPMRYEFTKREGGTIVVPEGMYGKAGTAKNASPKRRAEGLLSGTVSGQPDSLLHDNGPYAPEREPLHPVRQGSGT